MRFFRTLSYIVQFAAVLSNWEAHITPTKYEA